MSNFFIINNFEFILLGVIIILSFLVLSSMLKLTFEESNSHKRCKKEITYHL